jgi:hypothetical protein
MGRVLSEIIFSDGRLFILVLCVGNCMAPLPDIVSALKNIGENELERPFEE